MTRVYILQLYGELSEAALNGLLPSIKPTQCCWLLWYWIKALRNIHPVLPPRYHPDSICSPPHMLFPSPSPSCNPYHRPRAYPFSSPFFPTSFRQCVLRAQRIRSRYRTQFHWCLDGVEVHARNQLSTWASGLVEICVEKEILDRGGGGSGCRDNESRGHGLDCFRSWMGSLGKYVAYSSLTPGILADTCYSCGDWQGKKTQSL